ncbi:hypothetical protein [Nevskia soli]|uniref:hypothetical protein n=1 Tax=Nevskia soli TaxID=418856 RepID=UPI0015D73BDD|nr:hypothetical protein [Nevskia soli]
MNVRFCVEWAWNRRDYQIATPAALNDIAAKASGPATIEQLRQMDRPAAGPENPIRRLVI